MTTIEKIKSKVSDIDIAELVKRLNIELEIPENEEKSKYLLEYAIYDTLLIILDITHIQKVDESLYSIWVSMIRDYWGLNQYQKLKNASGGGEGTSENNSVGDVKSITQANEKVEFYEKESNVIVINGVKYNTGEIDFAKNVIYDKYKFPLYKHRRMRW